MSCKKQIILRFRLDAQLLAFLSSMSSHGCKNFIRESVADNRGTILLQALELSSLLKTRSRIVSFCWFE